MEPAKRYFAIIIFQLIPFVFLGQSFIHFPDSGVIWKEYNHGFGGPNPPNYVVDIYFEGDTILNDTLYRRLILQARDEYCSDSIVYGPSFYGWIREDTSNRKVYYSTNNDFNEKLLYDYSLQLGDTITEEIEWMGNCDVTVVDLETIVTSDGITRKIWSFNCLADPFNQPPQVIEGIGSTWGLTAGIHQSLSWSDLLCCTENNTVIWLGPQNSCNISTDTCATVGVDDISETKILIAYPNPTRNKVTFICNLKSGTKHGNIEIRNFLGKLVGKLLITQEKKKFIFDVKNFPSGIYVCTLQTAKDYATEKLVIKK